MGLHPGETLQRHPPSADYREVDLCRAGVWMWDLKCPMMFMLLKLRTPAIQRHCFLHHRLATPPPSFCPLLSFPFFYSLGKSKSLCSDFLCNYPNNGLILRIYYTEITKPVRDFRKNSKAIISRFQKTMPEDDQLP